MDNNYNNNNNNKNSKSNILFTDLILTKLLMEYFWDKTTTKTITKIFKNKSEVNTEPLNVMLEPWTCNSLNPGPHSDASSISQRVVH